MFGFPLNNGNKSINLNDLVEFHHLIENPGKFININYIK